VHRILPVSKLREHVRDKFIQPGFGFRTVERPAKIVGLRFAEGLYAAALDLRP
jgi:hypothetical protein